jgi:hypothetical protein
LDSDGDGCNDALEAGSATAGTTVPLTGAVGNNGLVNTLETSTDVGTISYTSTYFNDINSGNCFACEANFGVAIRNDGFSGVFCPGTTYTMRAPAQTPLSNFSYQWQKNGVDIVGATTAIYSTNAAAAGDIFKVKVTQISTGVKSVLIPYIDWPTGIKRMADGSSNTMGYIYGKNVYVWGLNDNGQIPGSSTTNNFAPTLLAKRGSLLYADSITQIGFTSYSGYALTTSGKLHVWGNATSTNIINGTGIVQPDPIELTAQSLIGASSNTANPLYNKTVVKVVPSSINIFALTSDGQLYAWGTNTSGLFGMNNTTSYTIPTLVPQTNFAGKTIVDMYALGGNLMVLCSDGTIYGAGGNYTST